MPSYSSEMNYRFIYFRGPLILLLTLSATIFPLIIRALSISTVTSSLFVILGLYITTQDVLHILNKNISHCRSKVQEFFEELMLDDFLQSVFGANGWLTCTWGSWFAIFVLYLVPLDKDTRLNILTKMLEHWIPPGRKDAREYLNEILFQPGGICKVDPKWWLGEENVSYTVDQDITCQSLENDLEMTWDAETESLNASETLYDSQLSRYEPSKENFTVISLASSVDNSRSDIRSTRVRSSASLEAACLQSRLDNHSSSNTMKIVLDVIRHIIRNRIMDIEQRPLVNTFSDTFISRIGMISSAILLAQLRFSPKSRRTLWTIGRCGTTIGLLTISAGSCCTLYCRRKFDRWIQDKEGKDFTPNVHTLNRIQNFVKSIFWNMRKDPRLKRNFQCLVTCIVFYYFRSVNLKLHQRKSLVGSSLRS